MSEEPKVCGVYSGENNCGNGISDLLLWGRDGYITLAAAASTLTHIVVYPSRE